ncbi:uncharacterized protein BDZ83DRAFT_74956 [Colletotrichum acutatum]|uniref:Uncharacterized protein n=1 Tax=Glomerella acutata TaxID=27357 RepID=A0AAD8U9E6_GLOAC|nr:uncharacterized protein BDZ83DRAFT_74956 [Colletotrichum acutatum]KAK1714136.1 hypothetical protein BDZ83DRAFT_74956 [Colletotrichum acutatum]
MGPRQRAMAFAFTREKGMIATWRYLIFFDTKIDRWIDDTYTSQFLPLLWIDGNNTLSSVHISVPIALKRLTTVCVRVLVRASGRDATLLSTIIQGSGLSEEGLLCRCNCGLGRLGGFGTIRTTAHLGRKYGVFLVQTSHRIRYREISVYLSEGDPLPCHLRDSGTAGTSVRLSRASARRDRDCCSGIRCAFGGRRELGRTFGVRYPDGRVCWFYLLMV